MGIGRSIKTGFEKLMLPHGSERQATPDNLFVIDEVFGKAANYLAQHG